LEVLWGDELGFEWPHFVGRPGLFLVKKKKGGCGLPNLFTSDLSAMFGLLTDMGAWDMA